MKLLSHLKWVDLKTFHYQYVYQIIIIYPAPDKYISLHRLSFETTVLYEIVHIYLKHNKIHLMKYENTRK